MSRDFQNNVLLKVLMDTHQLDRVAVCKILDLPIKKGRRSTGTLDNWLAMRHACPSYVPKLIKLEMRLKKMAEEVQNLMKRPE